MCVHAQTLQGSLLLLLNPPDYIPQQRDRFVMTVFIKEITLGFANVVFPSLHHQLWAH